MPIFDICYSYMLHKFGFAPMDRTYQRSRLGLRYGSPHPCRAGPHVDPISPYFSGMTATIPRTVRLEHKAHRKLLYTSSQLTTHLRLQTATFFARFRHRRASLTYTMHLNSGSATTQESANFGTPHAQMCGLIIRLCFLPCSSSRSIRPTLFVASSQKRHYSNLFEHPRPFIVSGMGKKSSSALPEALGEDISLAFSPRRFFASVLRALNPGQPLMGRARMCYSNQGCLDLTPATDPRNILTAIVKCPFTPLACTHSTTEPRVFFGEY